MRSQFPQTVLDIMDKDERVVVVLGDIGVHAFRDVFKKYPKRIFNIGICEQSMVSMCAGLAMAGFIPIVHTISPFLVARAYEQIRDDFAFQKLNGVFVGVNVYDKSPNLGFTHCCPEDIDLMGKWMDTYQPITPKDLDEMLKEHYQELCYIKIF